MKQINKKLFNSLNDDNCKFKTIKLLLKEGAGVNIKDLYGDTPLHFSCSYGNIEIVKLFIEKGANIYSKNNEGITPLDDAKKQKHKKIVKLLEDEIKKRDNKKGKVESTIGYYEECQELKERILVLKNENKDLKEANKLLMESSEKTNINLERIIKNLKTNLKNNE